MTTKPFDPTKPVQTRDGRPVRIICSDRKNITDNWPIIALIDCDSTESVLYCSAEGRNSFSMDRSDDLVNVPVRTSTWENVYKERSGAASYTDKSWANIGCSEPRIGYLRRDFEDGVFVSAEFEPLTSEREE